MSKLGEISRIPEGAILCTVGVVGLYPSIPHGEGLEAIREALDRRENPNVATDTGLAVCIFAGELSIARLICSGELNPEHI